MYTQLSDKQQEFNGIKYYLCGKYFQRRGVRLHIVVWEHFNGPVPDGKVVHHKDEDKSNNHISNLELMQASEHASHHSSKPERVAELKRSINEALLKAAEWHKSEAGLAWHSEQGKLNAEKRAVNSYKCDQCGCEFKTKHIYTNGNKFCSNKCRSNFRRGTKVDEVESKCVKCGVVYYKNKYSKRKCCSAQCVSDLRFNK